jgi:large subunit ribosomal protein L6
MSRVAKNPVSLPANVELTLGEGEITLKGPKGTLTQKINRLVKITNNEESKCMEFAPATDEDDESGGGWAQAGTARAIVSNMVKGVTEGFVIQLDLVGVGYRAQSKDKSITLSLGFSHPIEYQLPKGVVAETPSNTVILLKGADKQVLGQVASKIRAFRPPEPYKGKGVKLAGERIARKEAKKK